MDTLEATPAHEDDHQHATQHDDDAPTPAIEIQSFPRENANGDDTTDDHTWVPLSLISQSAGVSTKALRKRVSTRAPDAMVWRPNVDEMKTLVSLKCFAPSAQMGVLIRKDYITTIVPELVEGSQVQAESKREHSCEREVDAGATSLEAPPTAPADDAFDHDAFDHIAKKKRSFGYQALESLHIDSTSPPLSLAEFDREVVDTRTASSASTLPVAFADRSESLSPLLVDAVQIASMAAIAGAAGTDLAPEGGMGDMVPLTEGQKRRRGFVSVPDGLDDETRFKLSVVRAVSTSTRVPKAKRHQFLRTATSLLCHPSKPAKRSGSRKTMVSNADLVQSRLFIESLVPSVGSCLRSTVTEADDAVWGKIGHELGVARV